MTELATPTLEAIRVRVTRVLPAQVRTAVEKLAEEQIWWKPNEKANSVGNLVLHLSGSLNHYLNRNIGGGTHHPEPDSPISPPRPLPQRGLSGTLRVNGAAAEQTIAPNAIERLARPS